ncbi:MAG: sulfite exporter TauE/SafE family protein [Candidatus Sungbacteria bacterium]|uniref:Sulfite exporter TauE/SafE family protein n=1 Tax=Candidatus Sungiibacteriota bacterium TaxID=2750080 RepID=A0A9D6QTX7_9BACT|nr:sulfite exporter TauE/SafE family protein [Candidatus Sungbacteria bacterium]
MDVTRPHQSRDWSVFLSSLFFVLGFSIVFSLVGVLLQTVLAHSSYAVQAWLGRIGGIIIILFGLFVLGLFTPEFLKRDHKIAIRGEFGSKYLTSFVFGAAFAVGWTPCVSAALGAILVLAAANAGSAFLLLFAYTLGVGIPFLVVGLFTNQAQEFINKAGPWLRYVEYIFGLLLVIIGILIFVGELSKIANFQALTNVLLSIHAGTSAGSGITSLSATNFAIALFAGLASFLSPCVLPIIPGFLSYLAETGIQKK